MIDLPLSLCVFQPRYFSAAENQEPRRLRRGTVLNVLHCVFYKVVAVEFHSPYYVAKRRGMNLSARIMN